MARESENAPPVPRSLPPPYTAAGVQTKELRTHASAFATTTELLIGPKPTRFLLHTHLLTSQSPYFRASLLGPFLESATNSITLPDIDVPIFELLVSWLYTGSITPLPFKDGKPAYYTLLHLWIVADRLCFEGLRNQVVDTIAELADRTNSVLTPSDTRILYSDAVRSSSPLRALVLDLFAFKKTDKLLAEHEDRWHAGFLRDLVVLLKKPVPQAVQRHRLVMWFPAAWATTQACEGCRTVVRPRCASVRCEDCGVG
ncbi:uncharacterized protein EI97DRAFT_465745 [Westerdykella ornata]|uniref:BTB domain-containing protein n=1 Tax=Westerdykella ornata TaxID=318751 RepID=A0A6A6JP69_WESOR|nr:uncharacterized protein EI97DRAFT_465745 [Westerdykella ornata]KAF2278450.1 hypothetical protein EI97DRAFT_465745 [Westerdykella ornata]